MFDIDVKCNYCPESKMTICRVLDSINRITYRYYCTHCKMVSGAMIKEGNAKHIAETMGFEIKTIEPKTHEQYSYEQTMKNDILPLFYRKDCDVTDYHDFYIGSETAPSGHISHVLFCDSCKKWFFHLSDYTIKQWQEYCEDDSLGISESVALNLLQMTQDIKDITPLYPEPLAHKIPRHLLDEYKNYINSEKWQRKKEMRHALDNNQCVLCFSTDNLHVHHVTYERLFNELPSDLMTVCKSCHETIHGRTFDN